MQYALIFYDLQLILAQMGDAPTLPANKQGHSEGLEEGL